MEKAVGIQNYRRHLEKIQRLNLTSDLLASVVFEDIMAVQDILRILTGVRDLKVLRVEPQRSYHNLYGYSSVLDVWAEDGENVQYNMEIQIAENEDHLKRSRFIQSRIYSRSLGSSMDYDELPDLYLIFITAKDFLHVRTGITKIVRTIKGTDRQIENGVHEIYANLEYPAEDEETARLSHFIKDTNDPEIPRDGFTNLSNRVDYLKNETGGAVSMCELLERERSEGVQEGRREGRKEGSMLCLITLVMKKQAKGMTTSEMADLFEEDERMIERVLSAAAKAGSNEAEKIYDCFA